MRVLLLNQFHDILPGSSITEVYERARADLAEVVAGAEVAAARVLGPAGEVPVAVGAPARGAVLERPEGGRGRAPGVRPARVVETTSG